MGFIQRLAARFGYQPAGKAAAARSFDGALLNRLTAEWIGTAASIDFELRGQLDRLRQRSRDLAQNNDYVRRFLSMCARNIVGPTGFSLQARIYDAPNKPDTLANQLIEDAFDRWSRLGVCEVSGRMSFVDLCTAVVKGVARDGEALLMRVRGAAAGNPFGYALQLLDPARIDTTYNISPAEGRNAVIMGVEVNNFLRPVAYWLLEANPGDAFGTRSRRRVPAEDVLHIYRLESPEQSRGYPWLHTAMVRLHHLKGYEEAAIIASRVGASKMGFYTSPDGQPPDDEKDVRGGFIEAAEPGVMGVLPQGYDFKAFDPTYPHAQYEMFVKACLRGIASGLDISYHTLANDLEGVNFSSMRGGVLEERDLWMTLQGWFAGVFLQPVFEDWLRMSLLNKAIVTPAGVPLPMTKYDKFSAHVWQGRRWSWVDPLKDVQANIAAIEAGLKSRRAVIGEAGQDVEDVFQQLAQEQELAKTFGLTFGTSAAAAAASASTNDPAASGNA